MTYPLVTELAHDGIPVTLSCEVLGFSRQAYYAWRAEPVTQRDWTDAHLVNDLVDLHDEVPEFGYRLLADELRDAGWEVSDNRVARLCNQHGIASVIQRAARGKASKPGPPAHDDHVQRDFRAEAPDRIWFTDITEHPTGEGKLYLLVTWNQMLVVQPRVGHSSHWFWGASQEAVVAHRGAGEVAGRWPVRTRGHVAADVGGPWPGATHHRRLRARAWRVPAAV